MKLKTSHLLAAVLFTCFAVGSGVAAELPIIARARARLGTDAVLDAVRSIHYVGTLSVPDPKDPTKQVTEAIEVYLQKPARQRIVITSGTVQSVDVLDGYDAWRRVTELKTGKWQQSVLAAGDIKRLRADVWENLGYFRGLERVGGWVVDEGPATIDGVDCEKIAFFHSKALVYFRYFDKATGRLVYTGTPGDGITEEGEIMSGGIRFPRKITVTHTFGNKEAKQTIVYDKVTVNEAFPDSLFTMPLPIPPE